MLKFYWNGIKENGGQLQRAFFSMGALKHHPEGTITIYGRDYKSFSPEVRQAFTVENGSDMMTDYFEQDSIRVVPSHPLYPQVLASHQAQAEHNRKRSQKWNERRGIAHAHPEAA